MDLISVIIPYFKKKKFIDYSIKSVLNQTYSNYEIILIYDDKDQSDLEFLKNNYDSEKKIRFLVNRENLGAGLSRNRGIENANGKYICFIDSDDIWEKKKLENQVDFMQKNKAKISHTSYNIIDERNNNIGKRSAKNFSNYHEILKSCDIGLSSVMLEKNLITPEINFCNLRTKEDFVLWLKILKKGTKIFGINDYLTSWRRTKNSLSSFTFQKLLDGYKVYNKYMGYSFIVSIYYLTCLSLNYLKKKYND